MEQAIIPLQEIEKKLKPACVVLPGFTAGGILVERWKQAVVDQFGQENSLFLNSASSESAKREDLTPKTFLNKEYYSSLAKEMADKFKNNSEIVFVMHSGGGIEGLSLINAALELDDFHDKKIKLLFLAVPGLSEKGTNYIARVFDFAKRFKEITSLAVEDEHFDWYPPPEEYFDYMQQKYGDKSITTSPDYKFIYKETSTTRQAKRERYAKDFIGPDERMSVEQSLKEKDAEIIKAIQEKNEAVLQKLISDQAEFVSKNGEKYYHPEKEKTSFASSLRKRARQVLRNMKDRREQKEPSTEIKYNGFVIGAIYLVRLVHSVGNGLEKTLSEIKAKADKKHVALDVNIGILERDKIITSEDVSRINTRFEESGMKDQVINYLLIEGVSHFGVDISPLGTMETIEKISQI